MENGNFNGVFLLQTPPYENFYEDRVWYFHLASCSLIEFIALHQEENRENQQGIIFEYDGGWLGKFVINHCKTQDVPEDSVLIETWNCFKNLLLDKPGKHYYIKN